MRTLKTAFILLLMIGLLTPLAQAQNRTRFAGRYNAIDYAYGIAPGIAPLQVAVGNTSTGTASITLVAACTVAGDGTSVCPLATNTPILIGTGSTQDSITPTAVSNCNFPSAAYGSCIVTASFTYTHGTGEPVTTGSYGVQEAINLASGVNPGLTAITSFGGVVVVDRAFAAAGGTTAKITGAAGFSNVVIEDTRSLDSFWSLQPSTLTSLAIPLPTLTSALAVFAAAPVGTWANSAYYLCYTYVDVLGGEGPCSATSNQTPTVNYSLTVASPAASTGAVGWRMYAGSSYNAAYLIPITSTNCTLTTLESVMPACAMGASAVFLAPPLTTGSLRPNASVSGGALTTPTVNIYATQPQGHTTFAYAPNGTQQPQPFQTNYGPFPQFGSTTSNQVDVLGSVNLPAGFLNTIGRTIRISGKLALTTVNTSVQPVISISASWVGGTTSGVGVSTFVTTSTTAGTTASFNGEFSAILTTNAVGATAVGSIMPSGSTMYQIATGVANGLGPYIDNNVAAVGSLGLFAQDTLNIVFTSLAATTADAQLLDLHIEVLE